MSRPRAIRTAILVAAAAAPFLPGALGPAAGAALLLLWLTTRPGRWELALTGGLLALAVALGILDPARSRPTGDERWRRAEAAFSQLLDDLEREALAAREPMGGVVGPVLPRGQAFGELQRLAVAQERGRKEGWTWLLFDPDGNAEAWAGHGLLHEVEPDRLPRAGRIHLSSFTATTFLSIHPLSEDRRPWRIAVGRSLPTDRLPGESEPTGIVSWAVVDGDWSPAEGMRLLEAKELRIAVRVGEGQGGTVPSPLRTAAALTVAVAAWLTALLLWTGPGTQARRERPWTSWFLTVVAAATVTAALDFSPWVLVTFTLGLLLVATGGPRLSGRGGPILLLATTPAVVGTLLGAAFLLQQELGPVDLGGVLTGTGQAFGLRLAFFSLALGLLMLPAGKNRAEDVERWGWWSLTALGLGAAVHGWSVAGLVLSVLGVFFAVGWARRGGWGGGAGSAVQGCLLAAILAALAWEMTYHESLEGRLEAAVSEELAPPEEGELDDLAADLDLAFRRFSLEELTVGDPEALDPRDLAFAVWRRSPLVRSGALSAVVVGHSSAPLSRFSFGLPLTEEGEIDASLSLLPELDLLGWEDSLIRGEGELTLGGGLWTPIRYQLLLRPGFRSTGSPLERLAEGLLEGGPGIPMVPGDLPPGVKFGIYGHDGSVVLSPWKGAGRLEGGRVASKVTTPEGLAETFVAAGAEELRVLYLRIPSFLKGLERIATHALSPLLLLAGAVVAGFLLSLGQPARRRILRQTWRSFSKRLLILYTALLMIPVVLANVFVLRVFEQRLAREQRAAGEAALESAQRILGDYVLSLEPGFGVDTALSDEILLWLSRVVHHDINLYWGSRIYASSKRELFASGLLPLRIPGEIYSRLALEGSGLASRSSRAGTSTYQEFYAPLQVPGEPVGGPRLFLSTPLLAQEVEAAEEMAAIRRRVILAAIALALFLAVIGRRLTRRFTDPLLEIVEGTQRIAAGAPSIEIQPSETELVTLVEAIDDMARRIAEARAGLLREKELVDKMIDNINSGVVSVDGAGRVLLLNRVAHELFGIDVGEPLEMALRRRDNLSPVADFLAKAGSRPVQETIRLGGPPGEEPEWTLIWVPLTGEGEPVALLVVEDVSEVLRGQRLEAWAEMARMIAHEIKNPLTPIRLSAEHLREVRARRPQELDEVLERCTTNILKQVEELQQISSEFSIYSRIPKIRLRRGDLAEEVEAVVEGYRSAVESGIDIQFSSMNGPWWAEFDARLLRRAVRNLLENALNATSGGGAVRVAVEGRDAVIEIRVADTGEGVDPAVLPRIFEPYFSTEDTGTGLGLPIAQRIVEEHGGRISATARAPHGLEVVISLPREGRESRGEDSAGPEGLR
jgi:signal transduction histidine kinase/HAMP domain-containing protein